MISVDDKLGIDLLPSKGMQIEDLTVFIGGKYFIQGPTIPKIEESLGTELQLTEKAQKLYGEICTVSLEEHSGEYLFRFHDYPKKPWITRNTYQYYIWLSMVKKAEKGDHTLFLTELRYHAYKAKEWLEERGYTVDTDVVFIKNGDDTKSVQFGEPDVTLRDHQVDNLEKAELEGNQIVIADQPGLGKTITAGAILSQLNKSGKVKRILWVVPNSSLTEQVKGEMLDKFNADVHIVTGEIYPPEERLGLQEDDQKTVYEKYGFVCTNWALFTKDYTTNIEHTESAEFDAVVFDEAHRCKEGNVAYDAALSICSPIRIALSGTPMPNGDWQDLYDMLNVIKPGTCPSKKYYAKKFYAYKDRYTDKGLPEKKAESHAEKLARKIALNDLIPHVSYHSKDDVASDLPELIESRIHVNMKKRDKIVFDIYRRMMGYIIDELKPFPNDRHLSKSARKRKYGIKAALGMVYQDLRRFCAFGSGAIGYRVEKYKTEEKSAYRHLRNICGDKIKDLERVVKKATDSPKNKRVLDFIVRNRFNYKFVIFCTEIKPNKKLGIQLKKKGLPTKLIMGKSNTLTPEEADILDQPTKFDEDDVQETIDWFWMPWTAISRFLNAQRIDENLDRVIADGEAKQEIHTFYYTSIAVKFPREKGGKITIHLKERDGRSADFISVLNENGFYKASMSDDGKKITLRYHKPSVKILITTDKLQEGVNLQDAECMIFYDYPFSIRSREQRMSRVWRDGSYHEKISIIYIMNGIEYKIEKHLKQKYESSDILGYADPNPISMRDLFRMM